MIERQPEARHALVGNRDLPPLALLDEYRDYAAPAADDIPVARATKAGLLRSGIGVCLDKHLFRAQLGCTVQVDWIDRLVRTQRQDLAYTRIDGSVDDVSSAHDVGLDSFEGVVLTGRHLLERGGVDHDRDAGHRPLQSIDIPNIADEVAQAGMLESGFPHLVLFQLVAAENHQPARLVIAQHDVDELFSKGSRAARYQHRFLRPIHHGFLLLLRRSGETVVLPSIAEESAVSPRHRQ